MTKNIIIKFYKVIKDPSNQIRQLEAKKHMDEISTTNAREDTERIMRIINK
jgi:hypothetical protein